MSLTFLETGGLDILTLVVQAHAWPDNKPCNSPGVAQVSKTSLEVGGSVTLTAMMEAMQSLVKALPEHQTCAFRAMLEQLKYFAGVQIRNAASVAGNICTGSPISDLNPIYMACGAVFTALGKGTPERQVQLLQFLQS